MKRSMKGLLLLLLCLPVYAAQVYKWVDANGKVHYSDKPPPKSGVEVTEATVELENVDKAYPTVSEQPEGFAATDPAATARSERKQKSERQQQRACAQARHDLKLLSGRVVYYDDEGNALNVTEKQRAADEANLRSWIAKHC